MACGKVESHHLLPPPFTVLEKSGKVSQTEVKLKHSNPPSCALGARLLNLLMGKKALNDPQRNWTTGREPNRYFEAKAEQCTSLYSVFWKRSKDGRASCVSEQGEDASRHLHQSRWCWFVSLWHLSFSLFLSLSLTSELNRALEVLLVLTFRFPDLCFCSKENEHFCCQLLINKGLLERVALSMWNNSGLSSQR